jgi:hypothetical protein
MRTDLSISRKFHTLAQGSGLLASRLLKIARRAHPTVAARLGFAASIAMLLLLIASAGFGQHPADPAPRNDLRGPTYAGDRACSSCHGDHSATFMQTNHARTSSLPSGDTILGAFEQPGNSLKIEDPAPAIGDPGLSYRMERKQDRFLLTAITGFAGQLQSRTEPIDIVIGSGIRGQSYLYWRGDLLFELPVSYWSDGRQWINSPGYRNGPPNFDRAAPPRCLECHASYIRPLSPDPAANRYDRTTLQTGISCETCHGPGSAHVATHRAVGSGRLKAPDSSILNPATFSRERQIDLCALCHSGAQQESLKPAFSYAPGTPLEGYLRPVAVAEDSHLDVHANQVGLLKKSRCFASSATMTCSTCHQVHALERPAASYAAKCLGCHKAEACGMAKKLGPGIKSNCIDCHMPLEQTDAIVSQTGDKVIRTTMRTHWIRIYAGEGVEGNNE